MEIILRSNNETSIAKIIALAKKLDVIVENSDKNNDETKVKKELKNRILDFKAKDQSSFGDASEWQRNERGDRDLPFSR